MAQRKEAMQFIVLLGIVSLFADITYEGSRSIIGPYLSLLGASGACVGIVAGCGEFVGSGFRIVSGYVSDATKKYWTFTFLGYAINVLAVPCLAYTQSWQVAAFFILLERFGKAIRVPARDAMLSFATKETGRGWGFGIHEALDQVGAIVGPLFMTGILFLKEGYRFGFACLLLPAILTLLFLTLARRMFPCPQNLERYEEDKSRKFSKRYWIYLLAVGCVAAGYVDFALIAYHFQKQGILAPVWIPFFYSIAMAVDGLSALLIGPLFDKKGFSVLIVVTALSACFTPLVFFGGFYASLLGMVLWGIGMGSQESIMRASIAQFVPPQRRGAAYGVFHFVFGLFWAAGSAIIGVLYDISLPLVVMFSFSLQLFSIPLFFKVAKIFD
jgi:MFS family permease